MNHILVAFAGEKTRLRMTDIFESTGIRVSAACSSGAEVLRWCSRMSGGVHLHTLLCPDEASFRRVKAALAEKGLLYQKE